MEGIVQTRTVEGVPPEFRQAQDLCAGSNLVCVPARTPEGRIRNLKLFRRIGAARLTLIGERVEGPAFLRLVRTVMRAD
jgi:hypothetical protein